MSNYQLDSILDEPAPFLFEGDGELSNPGSPSQEKDVPLATIEADRPPDSTPHPINSPNLKSPPLSSSPLTTAANESTDSVSPTLTRSATNERRSSLDFRSRSSPLEPAQAPGHRPRSSLGGSFDQLRKRPVAPARMKRGTSQGSLMKSTGSAGSVEGRGTPSPTTARSPTPGEDDQFVLHRRTSTPTQFSAPLSRSFSDATIALSTSDGERSSTDFDDRSTPAPVTGFGSPPSSIDSTSYHPAPISPIGDIGASPSSLESPTRHPNPSMNPLDYFDSPDRAAWIRRERSRGSLLSTDTQLTDIFAGEGGLAEGDAFQPDSWGYGHGRPGSTASSSSADQFQALLRQAHELSRKLKESEARFATSASTYEQDQLELEGKLDEARAELQDKRRQEKDLRSNEKQHLAQIASLEADIGKITKSLERSRELYEGMKRQADDLRALVAETRRESRQAEETVQLHAAQVQQFEQDNQLLQQAVSRLEAELVEARSIADELDAQKQENLSLKETIDRLRFDLDEIHATSKKASVLAGGGGDTDAEAGKLTVSKSLGRELAMQLAGAGEDSGGSEGEEESAEEDEDIVVTTTRRVRKRGGNLRKSLEPVVTEHSTIVVETGTQTDPIATATIEIQTELSVFHSTVLIPEPVQVVSVPFETQTERPPSPPPALAFPVPIPSSQELRQKLANDLGIELEQLERFVEKDNREPSIPGTFTPPSPAGGLRPEGVYLPRRVGRWASRLSPRAMSQAPAKIVDAFPHGAQPLVAQILDSTVSFALYSAVLYLSGVLTGSAFFAPTITHIHPFGNLIHHDTAAWHAFNQVPLGGQANTWTNDGMMGGPASGVTEAVQFWLNRLVWSGVGVVRRVPV